MPRPSQDAAGGSSFAKALFAGEIREEMVFPFPGPKPEEAELLRLVLDNLRKFASEKIDSAAIDARGEISEEVLGAAREMGLFGLQVPAEFGGMGLSQTGYNRVFEELGAVDASFSVLMGAHQSIGMKALLQFGTAEQKQRFLPDLASGRRLAAFALTEPGSGSDAYSIKTRAVEQPDGSYLLNGNKIWITNGGIADLITLFAKTEAAGRGAKKEKITAFLVTRDMKGFSSGKPEKKMGIRGSNTTELALSDVRVPRENLLGEPGKGFKIAMEVLNSGRLGLAAGCLGGAKNSIRRATAHAVGRKQFGRPIADFGMIKEKLGRMTMETYVVESIVYLTAGLVDAGVPDFSIESAVCKVRSSESVWAVVNEALQVAGGVGYMAEYPYERAVRDTRINMIFEGTNEILRLFIALSGMQGVGEYLKEVGNALKDPIKSFGVLYDYFVAAQIERSLRGSQLSRAHPELKREAALIEEHVRELVGSVERAIRKHKSRIAEMQFVQKRVAEIVMDLYSMVAVVSRATRSVETLGAARAEADLLVARAYCEEAGRRIRYHFRSMDRNIDEELKELSRRSCEAGEYPAPLFR